MEEGVANEDPDKHSQFVLVPGLVALGRLVQVESELGHRYLLERVLYISLTLLGVRPCTLYCFILYSWSPLAMATSYLLLVLRWQIKS